MGKAQNKISGTVFDKEKKTIPFVSISIPEIHRETITDTEGKYELTNLPKGNFTVIFSSIGYATKTFPIQLLGKEINLNLTMEENVIHMDELVVSNAFRKLQSQNVMKVEHENLKSLQQKGASTLIEGLSTIPGVAQFSTGTSIGKPVIRGLSGNRILVYSQGVRMENQQFGNEHGLGLNDAGIESVEVLKGPASLLYGSDALGGVLYFNPEKFANPNEFKTDFSQRFFSNTMGSNSTFGIKTSTDNWKFLGRGSYNTHADYQIPNKNRVTNTRYNESDLKTGIGYNKSNFSTIFRYNYNHLDLGIPENGIDNQTTSHATTYPKQSVSNHILSLQPKFYFKNSKLESDLGYIYNDRSEFENNNIASLHMKLKTFNYDVKYYLPEINKLQSIIGIQGMHQTNTNFGEELLIPNATTNDIGIFGTVNYEWKTNTLLAGMRWDNRKIASEEHGLFGNEGYFEATNKNFNSFNASLGFKTDIIENFIVRCNVASGFRAPNLAELTSKGVHEGSNRYEIGSKNLSTEQNIQTDLDLEFKSSHFEFFANGFFNLINNYIFLSPNGNIINGFNAYVYSQANAKLYGGETGIHFHPHPLDWLHFTSSFEMVIGKNENKNYLPLIPANKWNNTIKGEFNIKNWLKECFVNINIENVFAQNNISEFETKTAGYVLLNLSFGGEVYLKKTHFNIHLNANNVLDKKYISHLSRLKSDGIPNIGRNIILGINFEI